ncbi:hypothetical protein G7B40_000395 [Aetokthonos hydrillicola Thurmond2011]|jgi:hypothetical protein|uniref:Proton extrusion protein PcxA n=1 Tax=Aetokthonos hydrillicola Thurmond2011 TaxID=2712845 RepID=A0AAP5M5C3_9CYAN|nr:hypothetical protein [Aetokthonos hydrillicola]MBO3460187.1 hypothetical protein [Aetokthonos hydrillicola CCALA 1050]MBW4590546.1 hypothetical protein [Aetokthonos hydrillicola CCALA 1050]MDR9893045.1 hypothetical protein [Aetokthonos hydrillicola Thurmond2011]
MNINFKRLNLNQFKQYTLKLDNWLTQRHIHLLDEAYKEAQEIKALEDKYFNGGKITYTSQQSKIFFDYVQTLRDRQLWKIRLNLAQFGLYSYVLHNRYLKKNTSSKDFGEPLIITESEEKQPVRTMNDHLENVIVEKLNFIDSVIYKYRETPQTEVETPAVQPLSATTPTQIVNPIRQKNEQATARTIDIATIEADSNQNNQSLRFDFFRNLYAVGKEISSEHEQEVIKNLRLRRKKNKIAVRWLFILLIVPIVVQIITKNVIFEPLITSYSERDPTKVELSQEIKEHFLKEFTEFKEELEIRQLLELRPPMTEAEEKKRFKEVAVDLWRESREEARNGIQNLLADSVALVVFVGLVYFNRAKLSVIRNFSNQTFLNLSDPLKVFFFILVTDMFVGFHSAEGWDVLLQNFTHHFGLPENEAAIKTFIATVPVIMDSCIKFWIFSYLTRFSPSASAIFERMNS